MKMVLTIAKWTALVAAIIAIGVIAFMIGRWTAPEPAYDEMADAEAGEVAGDKEQLYTCPMHPTVRTNDPNELCPICGMELVPMGDDDDEDDGDLPRLRVSQRAAALMNVQTVPARRALAEREVRLYGRIEEDERRVKTITAWAPGRLDQLHVDFTGQRVERDQPMVELYSPKLIAAQEELLQAIQAERELRDSDGLAARSARRSVEAARDRLRLFGVSPVFIDQLETTGEVREHITIPAPLNGIVTRRLVRLGDYVDTGDPLYEVADLSHLWMQLSVFESDLPWLHEGQTATFTTPSVPGRTFEGTVAFIDPMLDDRTRSVRVRIDIPNEDRLLKPGMFAQGVVRASVDREGRAMSSDVDELPMIVPTSAPLITGRRAIVYVQLPAEERPTFEARDVTLGPRAGNKYVILDGLEEGELVVVHGQFRIDSELQIRGRPSMMQPAVEVEPPGPIVPHHHAAHGVRPEDVPDGFAAQLANVLDDYLALSDAMAQDDYETAASIAHDMHERLYDIDADALDERVREAWEMLDRDLHEHLHTMLEAADLDSIRPPLEPLTEFVALMVANFIGDRAGTIYRAHCPMVDDFRGADWLQRETAIANPYFGSMMFRCGEIVGEVQDERHEGMEAERHEEERDEDEALSVDIEFPDEFRDAARAAIDRFDEIAGAIEHEHEDHARDAVRSMQDALFALDFDAIDDAMTQAWLRADVEIMDAARAILEADSLDAMRNHLPYLRESVERARQLLAPNDEGGDS
jgi:membrane fusion protein, copper/silver efflux system